MSAPQQRSRAPKGSFRPHARYVPKTDIASSAPANAAVAATSSQSASSDRKPTPPLTTSLRSTATAKPSTENKGDGRSVGSSFVRYLPQDEAVASGLGADAGGLDTVESQAVVDFLNDELCRLLKMKPRDFWKDVAKNESLHQFLDSYLQFRSRWYDFPHRGSRGMVAGVIVGEADLCRRVFLVLYRISSNRDPGALASDGLSVKDHTALLQEKKLLDLPKLLDICAIYGHENGELIKSLENFSVSTNVLITLPPYTSYSAMDPAAGSKRPRTDDTATETAPMDTSTAIVVSKQQTAKSTTSISTSKVKPTELIPRTVELLSLTVNPEYHQRLISSGELGYERPALRRIQEARYYEIDLDAFKRAMQRILLAYLAWKLNEQEILTIDEIDIEVNRIAPIIVDACITALYSKMRVIHIQYARYMTRFINLPTYARDVELPLPFADAIQNFGVYQPQNVLTNFIYIPVFPEGIQNEGRSSQEWNVFKYEAYVPILKSLGIPVKSVDTRIKVGSPWWLYRVNIVDSQFDLRCIFPPSNYSDHSALCASMFITFDDCGENFTPIVKLKNDDPDYPVRFREIAVGFQLRAFSSLCHAPKVEWSQALLEI